MGAYVCNCWQDPEGRSEPAEHHRGYTRKTQNNQRQPKADGGEEDNFLGYPHSINSSAYYASANTREGKS